jgi:hypothetical protein
MPQAIEPPGRGAFGVVGPARAWRRRLDLDDFLPSESGEGMIGRVFDHPATGRATVARIRANDGILR